jgi:hypothetical protein
MNPGSVSPEEARINFLYEKITGEPLEHGRWNPEKRAFALKIANIEKSCRSILDSIANLEKANDREDAIQAIQELEREFQYVGIR